MGTKNAKIRGHCHLCGIDERWAWSERRRFGYIRQMGVKSKRRVRRNDVSGGW